jgi:hypothetical protein
MSDRSHETKAENNANQSAFAMLEEVFKDAFSSQGVDKMLKQIKSEQQNPSAPIPAEVVRGLITDFRTKGRDDLVKGLIASPCPPLSALHIVSALNNYSRADYLELMRRSP